MIEMPRNLNPSRRDLWVFAGLWLAFFLLLAWLVGRGGSALGAAAAITAVSAVLSLAFNRDWPRRAQLAGVAIPLVLAGLWLAGRTGGATDWVRASLVGVGVVGAALAAVWKLAGRSMYRGWMQAAAPIGWTISQVILAAAFFVVVMPIGLAMRVVSGDPMRRRFDSGATSYWQARRPRTDPTRYFRQY